MNSRTLRPLPAAGPDCAAFEPLLPLASQGSLSERDRDALREHVIGCAHCQALLAAYDQLDAALQRQSATQATSRPPTEELLRVIMDPRMKRHAQPKHQRTIASIVAIAAIIAVVLLTDLLLNGGLGVIPGKKSVATPPPQPTATAIPLHLSLSTNLTSIAMLSASEGWVVGYEGAIDLGNHPFLFHYLTGAWRSEPLPRVSITPCTIAMVSATEGWIAGSDTPQDMAHGVMLHYSGGQWKPFPLPSGIGSIVSISMVSPSEGWAVDTTNADSHAQILHYIHGAWTVALTVPDNSSLLSISMASPTEGWAAGIGLPSIAPCGEGSVTVGDPNALWHYTQGTWRRVTLSDPDRADLEYVSMLSPTEGWGIGVYPLPHQVSDQYPRSGGAIWQLTGGQWRVVQRYLDDPAQDIHMLALRAVSSADVWISESDDTGRRFLHEINGTLQKVPAPISDVINSIAMISPTEGWAVGDGGQIMRYVNGSWVNYPTH